jgi:undecaprenyl-diphosphatase
MSFIEAVAAAILQGITELFPVSSLGHAVILPALLHWQIDEHSPRFLPFVVVLHVGTATALLLYFWRTWFSLVQGLFGLGGTPDTVRRERHLLALLVLGTLPAAVIGFAFEKWVRDLFASPVAAAGFLLANGVLLYAGERLRRRALLSGERRSLLQAGWREALLVGLFQSAAFLPGISRSGASMVGGLLVGLRHEEAARFSFLLATPIIAGAGVLEIPKILHAPAGAGSALVSGSALWTAGIVAGLTAYASTAFLLRYFRAYEEGAPLDPFAWYCWLFGGLALLRLLIG